MYRVVNEFNKLGHDVLNISRPGYGGTPTPAGSTPLRDSIPAFIDFIDQVRKEKCHTGIILVGHSIGGSLALSITYEAQGRLPILGVSAMGCLPTLKPMGIIGGTDPEPENQRFIVESSRENIKRFMGRVEWLNLDALTEEVVEAVFEPGKLLQSVGRIH